MTGEIFEKVLVIGGTGFIGSNLLSELVAKGCSPVVLTRSKNSNKICEKQQGKTNLIELDIADLSAVRSFIADFRPTLIVNSAAPLDLAEIKGKVESHTNYDVIKNLLESSVEAKVKRIILFGSADEYGYQPVPQKEDFPLLPNSPYAVSKAETTELALRLHQKENLPIVILRPFTVYGAAQPKKMFLSQAVNCAVENRLFEMSEGKQKRDYIFIADFVRAIMSAIITPNIEGEVFNIGSGKAFPLREIAEKVWEISGADAALLKIGARKAAVSELHDTCADITKAEKILNWQPKISLADGLNQTIQTIRENSKL